MDRSSILTAVQHGKISLNDLSEEFRNDREIVLIAIAQKKNGFCYFTNINGGISKMPQSNYAIGYASDELRNDREIALMAIRWDGSALELVSDKLQNDKKFIMIAVAQNSDCACYISDELKSDPEMIQYLNELEICPHECEIEEIYEELKNESLKSEQEDVEDIV